MGNLVPLDIPDEEFLTEFRKNLWAAEKVVADHTQAGENNFLSMCEMFPHGAQDTLYQVFTKAARCIGYEFQGDWEGVARELQDIINYAGFTLVFLNTQPEEGPHYQAIEPVQVSESSLSRSMREAMQEVTQKMAELREVIRSSYGGSKDVSHH